MGHILLIVNLFIWTSLSVADFCSHLPGYTVHGTSCFKMYGIKKTWAAAEASCVADGGHLASIHSSEEQAFLSDQINRTELDRPWIGLNGTFPNMVWSDGTEVDYWYWEAGNQFDYYEVTCTRIRNDLGYMWRRVPCNRNAHYICRANGVDQTQAYFTKIPDGVPMDPAVVPTSSMMVQSAIGCARRCKQDVQCVHFIMSQAGENYLCETYSSLYRPPTVTPPTDNYLKIV